MEPLPITDLYAQLNDYFLQMLGKGIDTHMIKVSKDPARLVLNLEVRPLQVKPQPEVWAGGVANGFDYDCLAKMNSPQPITPTVSRIGMKEPSVLEALSEYQKHAVKKEDVVKAVEMEKKEAPYVSPLASME